MESDSAIVSLTREQLKAWVRSDLADLDLVASLLADRRVAAQLEDTAG